MSHNHTHGSPYTRLIERLNRFPQGAPESKLLYDILKILMTEKEAGLMAQLPIKPFDVHKAAQVWQMPEHEAQKMLDGLASKALNRRHRAERTADIRRASADGWVL